MASDFDPEQEITVRLLSEIKTAIQLREEVPPRLLYRVMDWCALRIMDLEGRFERAAAELHSETVIG